MRSPFSKLFESEGSIYAVSNEESTIVGVAESKNSIVRINLINMLLLIRQ